MWWSPMLWTGPQPFADEPVSAAVIVACVVPSCQVPVWQHANWMISEEASTANAIATHLR